MRQTRNLKIWGLEIFLTALLFTTVFSQEQSSAAVAGSAAAVENAAAEAGSAAAVENAAAGSQAPATLAGSVAIEISTADNPARSRQSAAPGNAPGSSVSQNNRPANISELTAYARKSMKEHPVLTNLCLLGALLVIILINLAIRQIFLYGLKLVFKKIPTYSGEYKKQLYAFASRLAYIVPIVVVYIILEAVNINPDNLVRTRKVCMSLTLVCLVAALISFLNIMDIWYRRHSNTHDHSIKSGIQLVQLFAVIVTFIMIVSILMNRSPVMLLSGLGAVAAVLILIFQDTILALVSGIQLGTNHMIQLGDWIELPSENVDGVIVDIALHTVKVQNWDMTIVTVPTRKLTVETFINWRGIYEAGGRRIKRALNIDMRSVRFLTDEEIERLKDIVLLDDYLNEKRQEIEDWNHNLAVKGAKPVNGRRITNIGTFRIYVEKYLRSLKTINPDLTLLVRQLQPDDTGLPIEVYCFTKTTEWAEYEKIQSDIFDHLLAILPMFDLRVFQRSSDIFQEMGILRHLVGGGMFQQDACGAPESAKPVTGRGGKKD